MPPDVVQRRAMHALLTALSWYVCCLCCFQVRMTHVHGPPVYDASSSSTTTGNSCSSSGGSAEVRDGQQQEQMQTRMAAPISLRGTDMSAPGALHVWSCPSAAAAAGGGGVPPAAPAAMVTATTAASTPGGSSCWQQLSAAEPASAQAVKSMSCDEIFQKWRSLLGELSAALAALQDASAPHASPPGTNAAGRTAAWAPSLSAVALGARSSSSSSSAYEQLEQLTERSKQPLGTAMVLNPGEHTEADCCSVVHGHFWLQPCACQGTVSSQGRCLHERKRTSAYRVLSICMMPCLYVCRWPACCLLPSRRLLHAVGAQPGHRHACGLRR